MDVKLRRSGKITPLIHAQSPVVILSLNPPPLKRRAGEFRSKCEQRGESRAMAYTQREREREAPIHTKGEGGKREMELCVCRRWKKLECAQAKVSFHNFHAVLSLCLLGLISIRRQPFIWPKFCYIGLGSHQGWGILMPKVTQPPKGRLGQNGSIQNQAERGGRARGERRRRERRSIFPLCEQG